MEEFSPEVLPSTCTVVLCSGQDRVRAILRAGLLEYGFAVIDTDNPYHAFLQVRLARPECVVVDICREHSRTILLIDAIARAPSVAACPLLCTLPGQGRTFLEKVRDEYHCTGDWTHLSLELLTYPFPFSALVSGIQKASGFFGNSAVQ